MRKARHRMTSPRQKRITSCANATPGLRQQRALIQCLATLVAIDGRAAQAAIQTLVARCLP